MKSWPERGGPGRLRSAPASCAASPPWRGVYVSISTAPAGGGEEQPGAASVRAGGSRARAHGTEPGRTEPERTGPSQGAQRAPTPDPGSFPAGGQQNRRGAGDPGRTRARLVSRVAGRAAAGEAMSECEPATPSFEMTWSSTTSSGYCSQEDSDSELEQYFTARTSFIRKPHKDKDEQIDWEKPVLSQAEIEQKIKEYNSQINSNLFMSLNKDGSYTGFIKVQLKLIRPVSVPASKKPPSIQDMKKAPRSQAVKRRTSFYLPKDTVKHLHIISRTRASEVIEALLRKFMVVDNPRKFALFERAEKDDQVYLRKLSDEEQPLRLRLLAGPSEKTLSFVLKENETGEVNWDAFSMPELHNFLRILQREEEEHVRQILQKYTRCRQQLQEALTARTPG
ncbi:ras association domain-containing protein 1 isoform X1 [Pelodiscus sinensis]|uniref:ras association domain-containing protein 1 isoform X1 n=1 Tax=Pelodiscus sinensis TaxID=13735 RepID=UPI003F6BA40B